MTVLIAGGGIVGLTLGLSLHQAGIPFRIFEAVRALKPLGVGINLQPQAVRELYALGLEPALDRVGLRTEEVAYLSSHGQLIWAEPRGMKAGYAWPQFSVHRGQFQMALHDALVERAGAGVITTGAALKEWEDTADGIEATFIDRSTGDVVEVAKGDVLIAADGINSTARARLYPDEGPAKWGGTLMWRGTTIGPRYRTGRTVTMAGAKTRKFVAYPIGDVGDASLINWIADLEMPADYLWNRQDWNRPGKVEDVLPAFADWHFDGLDVPAIIKGADELWEYPMVDRDPLPRWTHGRMTLIGDAAHAMYPIGSNGASQGIVDARVLAREMRDRGVNTAALEAYEDVRREAVNAVVLANRGDGPDKILDIVEDRAPDGFENIEQVMPTAELQAFADKYKKIAGMDIAALNASPAVMEDGA